MLVLQVRGVEELGEASQVGWVCTACLKRAPLRLERLSRAEGSLSAGKELGAEELEEELQNGFARSPGAHTPASSAGNGSRTFR